MNLKKQISALLLFSILLLSFPAAAYGQELPQTLIASGYTEDGVYYEVYGAPLSKLCSTYSSTPITVSRTVVYQGNVTPARELPWTEKILRIIYSGTLKLKSFSYNKSTNKTTAVYSGTLSPQ